jgi:hypothetical protein
MTLKQSGIEGFADGVAIGTVGAGSGEDAFNTAATNPGGVGAQRHANAANKLFGDVAAKFSTSTTAATAIIGWSWTSSTTTSFRAYVKFSGNPPSTLRFLKLIRSSGNSFELALTTSRQIRILNISAATVDTFSAISLNTWYRIEGTVTHGASTGAATVSIYRWDESEPIQTKSVRAPVSKSVFSTHWRTCPSSSWTGSGLMTLALPSAQCPARSTIRRLCRWPARW